MSIDPAYETRIPPEDDRLAEAARSNRGGWVYDLDFEYMADESVPPEAIRGAWEVSESGSITGRYMKNDRYRPIEDCDRPLKPYVHAAARFYPGKWVSEVDQSGEHLFPNVPDKLIRGWWLVGKDGIVTEKFRPSSLYNPVSDLFCRR
jgi:hypothetical protein